MVKLAVCLLLLLILVPCPEMSADQGNLLVQALLESGADLQTFDIIDWSVINREFLDYKDMENNRDVILDLFNGAKQDLKITKEFNDMSRILNTETKIDDDTLLHIIQQSVVFPAEFDINPQTYLVIAATGVDMSKLTEMNSKVKEAVKLFEGESKITTCVSGTFNGKLNGADKANILNTITSILKIENIEKNCEELATSLTGYSSLLSEGIKIIDGIYNINIVLRYNSWEDKTYIWMGTPVISLEY
ncbi:MAG: YwmB family TATA-box binding protein [Tepidanaerobacteraceae bacterium]